ncbi:WAP four-disulfide core domain protein 3-like [Rana temporaria]|uniref:WAP four-disulfide core domain protein 3-like n=1 Tax=Rana temporaria TaxID=8407 RepID=UPI001AAD6600|nr:WAP four-disulfide core domain protein 3-like [Rana temporaria]
MRPYHCLFMFALLLLWVEVKCMTTKSKMNKQGLCPKPAAIRDFTTPCNNNCSSDSDCPGKLRCCDTGCGHQCVYGVRTGFCPNSDIPDKGDKEEQPKCASDFDCIKPAKCCDRGSSKDCLPASREKPGKCPGVCETKSDIPCTSDHDCPKSLKCCSNWCEKPLKVTHAVPLN